MNWAYIAGLFDGDGSVAITSCKWKGGTKAIYIIISITSIHRDFLFNLKDWFKKQGISASVPLSRKRSPTIQLSAEKSLKVFLKNVLPHACLKKRQLEIIQEALELRNQLKNDKNRTITNNLHLFNPYRKELHSLALKGPKTLKNL